MTHSRTGYVRWRRIALWIAAAYLLVSGLAWHFQESLIFHPVSAGKQLLEHLARQPSMIPLTIERKDATLQGFLAAGAAGIRSPCVLYFGGNAENVLVRALRAEELPALGWGFATVPYRGYAPSTGEPTVLGILDDALAVFDALAARPEVAPSRIVLWGLSLGTGVAQHVASRRPAAGVILMAPYSRLSDIASQQFPFLPVRFLLRGQIDPIDDIARQAVPALILHGTSDQVIPIGLGDPIAKAWPARLTHYRLAGYGHDDLENWPSTPAEIGRFLASIGH